MNPTLRKKLHMILHRGFIEARKLALARNCDQLYDLADTLEIMPFWLDNWQEGHLASLRDILAQYQAKYHETASDYLSILEMTDAEFEGVFDARQVF